MQNNEYEKRSDPSEYSLLNSTDGESLDEEHFTPSRPNFRSRQCSILQTSLTALAVILLATILLLQAVQISILHGGGNHDASGQDLHASMHPDTVGTPAGESGRCGFTAAEAIEKGCVFDYMNFAWLPPECYDQAMDEQFTGMMRKAEGRQIRWWADANLTKEVPDDAEVLKWYEKVWVERKYHYHHCTYGWALLHQSYNDGGPLPDLMTYNHSLHCAHVLKKAIKEDNGTEVLIERAVTWFSDCIWPNRRQ